VLDVELGEVADRFGLAARLFLRRGVRALTGVVYQVACTLARLANGFKAVRERTGLSRRDPVGRQAGD
jgi:hypothetical protein